MKIGAQFYNLRDFCKTPEALEESIKKVADIGFSAIQLSGTCNYDPSRIKKVLDECALTCCLTHRPYTEIKDDIDNCIENHRILGCKYIGLGSHNSLVNESDLEDLISVAHTSGRKMAEQGFKFMYHNHSGEFNRNDKGLTRLEVLLSETTPDELGITLDTYWLHHAGCDLNDWIPLLSGRIPCVHFKDMKMFGNEVRMAPVGHGNLPFEKYLPLCESAGAEYIIAEQDNAYGEDPFEELKKSYLYLKSLGLE